MKETYQEKLQKLIRKHGKKGYDPWGRPLTDEASRLARLAARYYSQRLDCSACASFETFIKSWAGAEWLKEFSGTV